METFSENFSCVFCVDLASLGSPLQENFLSKIIFLGCGIWSQGSMVVLEFDVESEAAEGEVWHWMWSWRWATLTFNLRLLKRSFDIERVVEVEQERASGTCAGRNFVWERDLSEIVKSTQTSNHRKRKTLVGSQHPSPNVKTLCNFEPNFWPETITSRDAESTCFKGSRTSCAVILFGAFGPNFGRKRSQHVMDASCWTFEIPREDNVVDPSCLDYFEFPAPGWRREAKTHYGSGRSTPARQNHEGLPAVDANVTLPPLQKTFVNLFLYLPGIFALKMAGIFGEFFQVSASHEKKHENSLKIRENFINVNCKFAPQSDKIKFVSSYKPDLKDHIPNINSQPPLHPARHTFQILGKPLTMFSLNFTLQSSKLQTTLSVATPAEPRGEKKLFFVQILGGEKLSKFVEKCQWNIFKRPERG